MKALPEFDVVEMSGKKRSSLTSQGHLSLMCDSSWPSFLLNFHDEKLEQEYSCQFLDRVIDLDRTSSRTNCFIGMSITLLLTVSKIRTAEGKDDILWTFLYSLLLIALVFLHHIWMCKVSRQGLLRWRTVSVVGVQLAFSAIFCVASIPYFCPEPLIKTMQSCWYKSMYNTGIVTSIWMALGHPLLFKHHVWIHTLAVLMQMGILAPRFCAMASWSDNMLMGQAKTAGWQICDARDAALGSCLVPFSSMRQMSTINNMFREAEHLIFSTLAIDTSSSSSPPSPFSVCTGTILFLQLVLGWWLPTMVLYHSEQKARMAFLLNAEGVDAKDLFTVKVAQELETSTHVRDRICRVVLKVMFLMKSMTVLILVWHLLPSLVIWSTEGEVVV